MDKYRRVMDGIQQNPEEVRKLHENIDRILEQKSEDDFVSIGKTAHIVNERDVETYKVKRGFVRVASAAAAFLLVAFASFLVLRGLPGNFLPSGYTPDKTSETVPAPTPETKLYEDIEGIVLSKEGISELFQENGLLYGQDKYIEEGCYNVTTPEIKDKTGCTLVLAKVKDMYTALLILKDDKVIELVTVGGWFIHEIECSDFNNDGSYEILISVTYLYSGVQSPIEYYCIDVNTAEEVDWMSIESRSKYIVKMSSDFYYMKKINDQTFYLYSLYKYGYLSSNEDGKVSFTYGGQVSPRPTPTLPPEFADITPTPKPSWSLG